jgi:hypothetical protein
VRLHICVPFELVDPVLSSRQVRLLWNIDVSVVGVMGAVAGQLRGQLVASLLLGKPFA